MIATEKRRIAMTGPQASVIIALESLMRVLLVDLVCPRCAIAHHPEPWVSGANAKGDAEWFLTCPCTTRVIVPASVVPVPVTPDLVTGFAALMRGADLSMRCPRDHPECRYLPLTHLLIDGELVTRCGCRSRTGSGARAEGVH